MIKSLPLKEDLDEYKTVLECIAGLYKQENPDLVGNMGALLRALAEVVATDKLKTGKYPERGIMQHKVQMANIKDSVWSYFRG